MDLSHYQKEATKTDQVKGDGREAILVPLLGLAGEVGTLLSEYKKFLRDGPAHSHFHNEVEEDLGDLLWYVANVATKFGLDLSAVAEANLKKTQNRWPSDACKYQLFDEALPSIEQMPRRFQITFAEKLEGAKVRVVISRDGVVIGDPLTDNAHEDDGYRFHDVFHFSYAAVLGWSPISRSLLKVKRKSQPKLDEIEDGARAKIIEELISQLVYTYAREHNYLEGVSSVDYDLLQKIHTLVSDREVKVRSLADWERAILTGYNAWRHIRQAHGGTIDVDLLAQSMVVVS
ncbi:MAG: nucleoside triphosphate pyrophosphohydrolase family protein [Candidatus Binatia bacterium]